MSRRAAITRAPKGGAITKDETKYKVGSDPLEIETTLGDIQPTSEQEHKKMLDVVQTLLDGGNLSEQEKRALTIWKTNLLASTIGPHVKKLFVRDFWAWLLGRGTEEDTRKTPWKRQPLTDDPEVEQYVSLFPTKMQNYRMKLFLLAHRRPLGIGECYLFFKYIVRGDIPHDKDGNISSFNPDFLRDWETFGKDFDIARADGQEPRRPTGSAHEMAPYGDKAAERAKAREDNNKTPSLHGFQARGGAGPRDVDSSDEDSSEDSKEKGGLDDIEKKSKPKQAKATRVNDPEVAGKHEDITAVAKQLMQASIPLIRQSIISEGVANVRGQQEQFEREAGTRMQQLERQIAEQQQKFREEVEIAQRAGLPAPPQPQSEELVKEAEALRGMVRESTLLLEEARQAEAARESAIVIATKEGLASIQKAVAGVETGTQANARDIADLTTTVTAIGKVLAGVRGELANMQSAYASKFATSEEFIQKLQQQHTTALQLMQGLQQAQERVPLLLEGFRQTEEAKRLEITTLVQQRVAENANNPQQLAQILREQQTKVDMEANKRLVFDYASQLSREASAEGGSDLLAKLTHLQSRLAREAAGLSHDDAARMIGEMGSAYRTFVEQRTQLDRAKRIQEAEVAQNLRLTGAQQAALLENREDNLRVTQIQTLELTLRQKEAEIAATEAAAKQQALMMEAARQAENERMRATIMEHERQTRIAQQEAMRLAEANRRGMQQMETLRIEAAQATQQSHQELQMAKQSAADELREVLRAAKYTEGRVYQDFERLRAAAREESRMRQEAERTLQKVREDFAARVKAHEEALAKAATAVPALPGPAGTAPQESELQADILRITAAQEEERKKLTSDKERALERLHKSYRNHRTIYINQGYNKLPPLNPEWSEEEIRDLMTEAKLAMQARQTSTFNADQPPSPRTREKAEKRQPPKEKEELEKEEEQRKKGRQ